MMKHSRMKFICSWIFKAFVFSILMLMILTASVTITASAPGVVEYISADTEPATTVQTQICNYEFTAATKTVAQKSTAECTTELIEETPDPSDTVDEAQICEETYNYSEDTLLLAKVIYLEAGTCSSQCQWLVGSTAMNLADEQGSLSAVAYNYNTFNVAYLIDSCDPSDESIAIAEQILSGDRNFQVRAFKTDSYHDWATPYTAMDNVYFSSY